MNKLLAFFLCLLLGTVAIDAQFKKSVNDAPRHRIMMGIGGPPITSGGEILNFRNYGYDSSYGNILDYYYGSYRTYRGETLTTGAIFAEYGYRISRWFDLGINITYTGFITRLYNIDTRKRAGNESSFYISAIPMARIMWVKADHVNLYSGIGLGVSYYTEGGDCSDCLVASSLYPAINITPIGIMVGGKKVFGFSEFCIGYSGIFNIGVGVRL